MPNSVKVLVTRPGVSSIDQYCTDLQSSGGGGGCMHNNYYYYSLLVVA